MFFVFLSLSGSRSSSGSARVRNDRSMSPGSRTPSASSGHRANRDSRHENEGSQGFDQVDEVASRPLGSNESAAFEEQVTKAGLDDLHRDQAMATSEVRNSLLLLFDLL